MTKRIFILTAILLFYLGAMSQKDGWIEYSVMNYITLDYPETWQVSDAFEGCGDVNFKFHNVDSIIFEIEICPTKYDKGQMDWVSDTAELRKNNWKEYSKSKQNGLEKIQVVSKSDTLIDLFTRFKCNQFTVYMKYVSKPSAYQIWLPIITRITDSIKKN